MTTLAKLIQDFKQNKITAEKMYKMSVRDIDRMDSRIKWLEQENQSLKYKVAAMEMKEEYNYVEVCTYA